MSLKREAPEGNNDSDSNSEDGEGEEPYLKIYYPRSSEFFEVPLYENGRCLLIDIKAVEPKIVALNLVNAEKAKRYDAVNGSFEEPAEKWSSFKVVAILNDPTNGSSSAAFMNTNASTVKSDPDSIQQPADVSSVEASIVPIKQEPRYELDDTEFQPSTVATEARQIKQEAYNSPMESTQVQQPTVSSSIALTIPVKQEPLSSLLQVNVSLPSSSSSAPSSNISQYHPVPSSNGYNRKSFDFFTTTATSKNKTTLFNNMKNESSIFVSTINYIKFLGNLIDRVMGAKLNLPFDDPLLIEKLVFLNKNIKRHPNLKDIFPESLYCLKCNKSLQDVNSVVCHTFTNQHFRTALTQDELDNLIEAVSVIDYSADGPFFTALKVKVRKVKPPKVKAPTADQPRMPATLNVASNGEYEFFTNQFYPKKDFDRLKRHLVHRIIEADLKLPFNDPLFIEKLMFLRENFNYRRTPKMREVFPRKDFCENCNKRFANNSMRDHFDQLAHILKDEHIGLSLTQQELNQLYDVLTVIYYSVDGFYFTVVGFKPKKKKNMNKKSKKDTNFAKRQRYE